MIYLELFSWKTTSNKCQINAIRYKRESDFFIFNDQTKHSEVIGLAVLEQNYISITFFIKKFPPYFIALCQIEIYY